MTQPTATLRMDRGTGPSDLLLVQQALRGDRPAVDAVLKRLDCIVRFVYRLNRAMGYHLPTEGLEDVAQQVYVTIWPRLNAYAGTSALETWIYGFCRNCLRAESRRRYSRRANADVPAEEYADSEVPEERAIRMESVDLLHAELDRLDDTDREIVELRHLQGWSFEEISRQKNLAPSTVKDRCYKALERIRTRLKKYYGRG